MTDWKLRNWTVEGAIIVSKNKSFNVLHHTNVNEYNICTVCQRLATPNGVLLYYITTFLCQISSSSLCEYAHKHMYNRAADRAVTAHVLHGTRLRVQVSQNLA